MLCWILFKLKYHALDLSRLWVANGSLLGHCSFPFCHYPSIFTSSAPYDPYPRTCASLTLHLSITISSHGNLLIVLVMTIMTSGSCCLLAVFLHTRAASEYDVREPFYTQSQNGRGRQALLWVTQSNPLPKQGHPEQAALRFSWWQVCVFCTLNSSSEMHSCIYTSSKNWNKAFHACGGGERHQTVCDRC